MASSSIKNAKTIMHSFCLILCVCFLLLIFIIKYIQSLFEN